MTYLFDDIKEVCASITDGVSTFSSTARAAGQPMFSMLLVAVVLLSLFSSPVAAQAATDPGFLCDDNDDSQFVTTLSSLLLVLMVGGPVVGTLMAAFATVAAAGDRSGDGNWINTRKNSLIYGWSVPIIVYGLEILAGAILGFDISCIIP